MNTAGCIILVMAAASIGACQRPELCNPMDGSTDCGLAYSLVRLASPAASTPATLPGCATLSSCMIFVTSGAWNGSFGGQPGISGADARCNADGNKPASSGTYKAMIVDGTSRRASVTAAAGDGQIDWVLYADKQYKRPDGTAITSSSSTRLLIFPLTSGISSFDIPTTVVWTGLASDWTTGANICLTWTDVSVGQFGATATEFDVTTTAIQSGTFNCSTPQALYCVQQ